MNEYPNSLLKFVKIFLLLKAFPMYLFLNFGALHRLRRGQRHRHCLTFPPAAKERRHPCQAKRHLFRAIPSACGFVSAFVSGLFACKLMIALVKKAKLKWFALYCALIGLAVIISQLV